MDILFSLLTATLLKWSPLLCCSLAVALAFRGGLWNIGAEGQFLMGAAAATWVGVLPLGLSGFLWVPLCLLAGVLAGAVWGFLPGVLRVGRNVPEVITTILLNFVALEGIGFLVHGPLQEKAKTYPMSDRVDPAVMLPVFGADKVLHFGLLIALITAVICYFFLMRTSVGYKVRAMGHNEKAVSAAGFSLGKLRTGLFVFSGGMAALGGAIEVLGVSHRLFERFSPGYGFAAIAVALLGKLHPLWIILSSFLFALMYAGAGTLERVFKVPSVTVYLAQAVVIFAAVLWGVRKKVAHGS